LTKQFLDVSKKVNDFAEAEALAKRIKKEIYEKEGLTCTIGVGPNKLVAKVASDFQKPNGLIIVRESDVEKFLHPLPARKLLWVGRKTEEALKEMGINTIGDLSHFDPTLLAEKFGVAGTQMYLMAQGIDRSKVKERSEVKSISHETTFEEDTIDMQTVAQSMSELAEELSKEAASKKLYFKTVTIKIRYGNFETHTRSRTLQFMTNRAHDLKKNAQELLFPYLRPDRKIRLIGLRVSTFVSAEKQQTLA
jgi:DNA polymerase IV (DinB-like DNA polymerase)